MIVKVLSLLEACFDLISGSSLHMKIQIMGGKITENLGFKSPLRKVKIFLSFFLFIFKFSIKNCISLFLTKRSPRSNQNKLLKEIGLYKESKHHQSLILTLNLKNSIIFDPLFKKLFDQTDFRRTTH